MSAARPLATPRVTDDDLPPELANAPLDDEPYTAEERAAVAAALADPAKSMSTTELLRSLGL